MKDNPTKNGYETPELRNTIRRACELADLDAHGARLIHQYDNAVYLLPAENAVARLQQGAQVPNRAATSLGITRWLVDDHDFPATAPLPQSEPIAVDETTTATFWIYYPQRDNGHRPTSGHLGELVRRLHNMPRPTIELPRWTPLSSLETALCAPSILTVMDSEDQRWLLDHIRHVRRELDGLDWPLGWGLVHGDAWAGNLLWNHAQGPECTVLGDWDSVCWGPREIDLIPSLHAARRYGRGPAWAQAFADAYGYDLSRWPGHVPLLAMRDLVQIAGPLRRAATEPVLAQALRQRIDGIRNDDAAPWREF
ncbi:phosphotransferase [Amycolatopsis pigmentata]|uniref:Phosphotransferase n=1 Tax=Amycolatopsis pigmentata TaxID=450801 RepID=A0ABW5FYL4_9PSEU